MMTAEPKLHLRIARSLGNEIVQGRHGTSLPREMDLADSHRASRSVIREALKLLAGKGMVESTARRGTRIQDQARWSLFDLDIVTWLSACPDSKLFADLQGFVGLIMPVILQEAKKRAGPQDHERVRLAAIRVGEHKEGPPSPLAVTDLIAAIVAAAHNPWLAAMQPLLLAGYLAEDRTGLDPVALGAGFMGEPAPSRPPAAAPCAGEPILHDPAH